MQVDFKNRTAAVCGCTQGIGKAIADRFAANGCNLVLIARDNKKLSKISEEITKKYGVKTEVVVADFDLPTELQKQIELFLNSHPKNISILVNNVRGPMPYFISEISPEQLHQVMDRHLVCNHILVRSFLPFMKKNGFGRVINIIDTIYHTPYPGLGLSSVRAAEASWSKALSFEVAEYGITVNNILPGPTDTDGLRKIMNILSDKEGVSYDTFRKRVMESVPLGRFAQPMEIAHAAIYLASDEASFITGTSLTIDGGFTPSI